MSTLPLQGLERQTARLRLLPLPLGPLALLVESRAKMERSLGLRESGLRYPESIKMDLAEVLPVQLQKVVLAPHLYPWYTNWEIIVRSENQSVGGMGLAGQPDAEGNVFIGYWIDARYQQRGYMTEALAGLLEWVFECPEALLASASTPSGNVPSQRVLIKNGFEKRGDYEGHPLFVKPRPRMEINK